ncbi:hypothetical protein [Desulfopila sp. IMCC35008]|uniref:hypothetical protein n=1 Tax=Desulfopila sp. IMCC35008 TaxID=2653858 RepID=UPI0013D607F2|nr:hypothetical protein [Desulfopila sp. IMCC35008]
MQRQISLASQVCNLSSFESYDTPPKRVRKLDEYCHFQQAEKYLAKLSVGNGCFISTVCKLPSTTHFPYPVQGTARVFTAEVRSVMEHERAKPQR